MPILPFKSHHPKLGEGTFLAPDAWVIGQVTIGKNVSIFFSSVLRGDVQKISVGSGTNIQEHSLLHTSTGLGDCTVGENVTVGHRAILHGCTVHNNCIIGMGSTILDEAVVGENCIIGASSLVTMGTNIPAGHLALGSPAKVIRELSRAEIDQIRESALQYQELGKTYKLSL
ncbi:MAG: gamma carbonic anhydrase family protein [Deltaproteobacteria bacterium]|nr:gamma carbonic anhydrase family protein [Deltaproteobacteria bacterium]